MGAVLRPVGHSAARVVRGGGHAAAARAEAEVSAEAVGAIGWTLASIGAAMLVAVRLARRWVGRR